MSTAGVAVLGAVAGFTIFLGLPMGRVEMQNVRVKTLLNGISAGILAFLLVDILANAGRRPGRRLVDPVRRAHALLRRRVGRGLDEPALRG